jgi:hypothetical protein
MDRTTTSIKTTRFVCHATIVMVTVACAIALVRLNEGGIGEQDHSGFKVKNISTALPHTERLPWQYR